MTLPYLYQLGSLLSSMDKERKRLVVSLMLNALLRQADSERFMAVQKLRGTGHLLSFLPLALDWTVEPMCSREVRNVVCFFHGIP